MSDHPQRLAERADPLSELIGRLPEPEAPAGTRDRVWRQLARASEQRSPVRWFPAAVGAACAAAVLVFFLVSQPASVGRVALAVGGVEVLSHDGIWTAPSGGQRLGQGGSVRTHADGRAYLQFDDAGAMLGAQSRAAVHRRGKRLEISLEQGYAVLADDPRPVERAFSVQAGDYTVRVLGTVFSVNRQEGAVEVRVQEGAVEVTGPNTEVRLHAGQSWSSLAGVGAQAVPPREAAIAARWVHADVEHQSFAELASEPVAAPVPVVEAPSPVAEAVAPQLAPKRAPHRMAVHAPAIDDVALLRARLVGASTSAQRGAVSYQLGKALAARGAYEESVGAYGVAAQGNGPEAESALYDVGRVKQRRLADPAGALEAFRAVEARFPHGQLGAEVRLSEIEALLDLHREDAALQTIDDFLARYPGNEREGEMRALKAKLLQYRHSKE